MVTFNGSHQKPYDLYQQQPVSDPISINKVSSKTLHVEALPEDEAVQPYIIGFNDAERSHRNLQAVSKSAGAAPKRITSAKSPTTKSRTASFSATAKGRSHSGRDSKHGRKRSKVRSPPAKDPAPFTMAARQQKLK